MTTTARRVAALVVPLPNTQFDNPARPTLHVLVRYDARTQIPGALLDTHDECYALYEVTGALNTPAAWILRQHAAAGDVIRAYGYRVSCGLEDCGVGHVPIPTPTDPVR